MKILLTILLSVSIWASSKSITIANQHFIIVKERYKLYDSKGVMMKLYNMDNQKEPILRLVLDDMTGDCKNKSITKGTYKIENNKLITYHLWDKVGDVEDTDIGFMIDIYEFRDKGIKKINSKIYMKNKNLSKDDIEKIEIRYHSTFVYDGQAKVVLDEVKSAIKKSIWN